MLKIYKTSAVEKKTKKVKKMTADCWIDLIVPTTDEIDKVVNRTGVDKDLIMKLLDTEELPRVEQEDNATLIAGLLGVRNQWQQLCQDYAPAGRDQVGGERGV